MTSQVAWASSSPGVATIGPDGLATGVAAGLRYLGGPERDRQPPGHAGGHSGDECDGCLRRHGLGEPGSSAGPAPAQVTSPAGTVDEGTVTFKILDGNTPVGDPVTASVSNGIAAVDFPLPAGAPSGTYTIQAVYNGTADFAARRPTTRIIWSCQANIEVTGASVAGDRRPWPSRPTRTACDCFPPAEHGDRRGSTSTGSRFHAQPGRRREPGRHQRQRSRRRGLRSGDGHGVGDEQLVITLAKAITAPDRVTITIGNSQIISYTRRLDVLPGDVDDNGAVNTTDGVLILRNYTPAHAYQLNFDMNGDGGGGLGRLRSCPSSSRVGPPGAGPASRPPQGLSGRLRPGCVPCLRRRTRLRS